jgi:hypothetical protein
MVEMEALDHRFLAVVVAVPMQQVATVLMELGATEAQEKRQQLAGFQ